MEYFDIYMEYFDIENRIDLQILYTFTSTNYSFPILYPLSIKIETLPIDTSISGQ